MNNALFVFRCMTTNYSYPQCKAAIRRLASIGACVVHILGRAGIATLVITLVVAIYPLITKGSYIPANN